MHLLIRALKTLVYVCKQSADISRSYRNTRTLDKNMKTQTNLDLNYYLSLMNDNIDCVIL